MRQHSVTVGKNAALIVKEVARKVSETVIDKTPVDTGAAISNWQAAVGGPATGTLSAYAPGSKGNTRSANTSAAKAQNAAVIAASGPGAEIHITNNAPHIGKLNDGGSLQAPAGFVEDAVLEGLLAVVQAPQIISGRHNG